MQSRRLMSCHLLVCMNKAFRVRIISLPRYISIPTYTDVSEGLIVNSTQVSELVRNGNCSTYRCLFNISTSCIKFISCSDKLEMSSLLLSSTFEPSSDLLFTIFSATPTYFRQHYSAVSVPDELVPHGC
jgi:hypothetical protein